MIDTKKISIILFLIFAIAMSSVNAQTNNKSLASPSKVKKFAKNAYRIGDIYSAIDFYKTYTDEKPSNYKVIYQLAELYRKSRNYKQAEIYYKKAYDANNKKFVKALYYHALMQKSNGKYKEARDNFIIFKKESKKLKDAKVFRKLVKADIKGCEISPLIIDSVLKVLVQHMGKSVNKAHVEFSPVSISNDMLLFASLRADDIKYYNPNDTSKKLPARSFYLAKNTNGDWKTVGKYPHELNNNPTENIGNGTFSADGAKFYFTKTTKNWRNQMISQIWVCKKEGQSWSDAELLPYPVNDPLYTTTQPSVGVESKKGFEMIFFVSDRQGGKGGQDIWYTLYDDKKDRYLKPKNAGSKINTVGDDVTPYYDMDTRTLYYSSTGKVGLGGLDIFKASGELRKWSVPENVGYPINSSADDLYFTIGKNREGGFFTSNRIGGVALKNPTCCDDIYSYRWTEYIHIAIEGNVFSQIKLPNADSLANKKDSILSKSSMQDARVSLYLLVERDSTTEAMFLKSYATSSLGIYNFTLEQGQNYRLVAEKEGYFNNQIALSTTNILNSDTLSKNLELRKIPKKSMILDNIYYEFDKSILTNEAKITIDTTIYKILHENEKLIVEISSHTDNKGKDSYNLKLSQKRAESVVKYLVNKGIDKRRLIAKGYGETKPIANNTKANGSDNPEGRQANRRTEFKVIGSSDQFSKVNYGPKFINGKRVK